MKFIDRGQKKSKAWSNHKARWKIPRNFIQFDQLNTLYRVYDFKTTENEMKKKCLRLIQTEQSWTICLFPPVIEQKSFNVKYVRNFDRRAQSSSIANALELIINYINSFVAENRSRQKRNCECVFMNSHIIISIEWPNIIRHMDKSLPVCLNKQFPRLTVNKHAINHIRIVSFSDFNCDEIAR